MKKKILIVVTSHNQIGQTGKPSGYYLPEVTHPYFELAKKGWEIDIASPLGGEAPMDPKSRDLSDAANKKFLEDPQTSRKLTATLALKDIRSQDYAGVLYAGGHGVMWDFAESKEIQRISKEIYEAQGVVAAVCHGPAALVNVQLSDGTPLVSGKHLTGFSNAEEEAAQMTKVVPFLLQTSLVKKGAKFESAPLWNKKVVVDGRLVTGQNPASAKGVGEAMAEVLNNP